jgi:hypothetical protein
VISAMMTNMRLAISAFVGLYRQTSFFSTRTAPSTKSELHLTFAFV